MYGRDSCKFNFRIFKWIELFLIVHSYQFHVSDNSFHTLPTNEHLHISPILSSCGLIQLTAKCHTAIHLLSAHIKHNAIGKTVRRKNVKLKGWDKDDLTGKIRGEGKQNTHTHKVIHDIIALHQLTNAQTDPEKGQPPSQPTPPSFIVQHDAVQYRISLWQVWFTCPGSVPFQLAVYPQPPRWLQEKLKSA